MASSFFYAHHFLPNHSAKAGPPLSHSSLWECKRKVEYPSVQVDTVLCTLHSPRQPPAYTLHLPARRASVIQYVNSLPCRLPYPLLLFAEGATDAVHL
jgi:hypothetical protein